MPIYMTQNDTLKWSHDNESYCLHVELDDDASENPMQDDTIVSFLSVQSKIEGNVTAYSVNNFWQDKLVKELSIKEIIEHLQNGACGDMNIEKLSDGRYNLHGKNRYGEEFDEENCSEDDIRRYVKEIMCTNDAIKMLGSSYSIHPVWAYNHSGISLYVAPANCSYERPYPYNDRFDSCFAGWAFVKKQAILENFPDATETNWRETSQKVVTDTLHVLNQWLENDIWWFQLLKYNEATHEWDQEDSCGGFYGNDIETNGMLDYVGHGLAEAIANHDTEKGTAKMVMSFGKPK